MSSAGNDRGDRRAVVDVHVSSDRLSVLAADGALTQAALSGPQDIERALSLSLAGANRSRRPRIWLGGALCRPVLLAPAGVPLPRHERARVAEAMAVAESGLNPPCRVWLDAPAGAGGVAVVVEAAALSAIDRALSAARMRAACIRPWWARALDDALARRAELRGLGVWDGQALTLLTGDGRTFSSAQTFFPVEDEAAAAAALARSLVSSLVPSEQSEGLALDWRETTSGRPRADDKRRPPPEGVESPGKAGSTRGSHDANALPFARWVRPLGARP